MTEQTMRAWAVTLSFAGGGPLILNTLAAPSAEAAAAMTMLGVCRMEVPAQELQGVGTSEMPADWLRWALKTIETGEPHKAPVVSLVPSEPKPGNDPNMGLQSTDPALASRHLPTDQGFTVADALGRLQPPPEAS
jgi:hypothetical protein